MTERHSELHLRRPGEIPSSDDPRSFTVRVDSAEVAVSPRSLSNLMNRHVFAYAGAPLKDIEVSIESGHLKQTGTARKGVDVPFSVIAEVSVTSDGRIRLHPISMKVMGVRVEADRLVEVFGPPPSTTTLVPPARTGFSFLSFRGGTLRFGRLTMFDTDLEIVGEVADRAIELSVPYQKDQLVAGYAKTRPNSRLVVHVPNHIPPAVTPPPHRP